MQSDVTKDAHGCNTTEDCFHTNLVLFKYVYSQDQIWDFEQHGLDHFSDGLAFALGLVCLADCQITVAAILLDSSFFHVGCYSVLCRLHICSLA